MITGYVVRCAGCGEDAPLAGELLSDLSDKVVAFQRVHHRARCKVTVEPPVVLLLDEPEATAEAKATATATSAA